MPLPSPGLDLTDRDFDAIRARLVALVESAFPDWSDFSVALFGNILLEMCAFVGDITSFYLDKQARESRLCTATQRKNVIALAQMLGYRLRGARAATAEIRFELVEAPSANVVIPAGTVVRTQEVTEPIRFQLLENAQIVAGVSPHVATGICEHSRTRTQLFDATGLAYQDLVLDFTPYLDGSAQVQAAGGVYSEVESLLGSGPNDRHFMVLVEQSDRASLRFNPAAPPTGSIQVTYKTGGGVEGNVDAGRLCVLEGAFTDTHGRPVRISVTNPDKASGGTARQSIASAKLLAPESLRAPTRTVSREDFEIHARQVPGVARALMLTSNEDASIAENSGILFVVPDGGGMPTPALKNAVRRQVTEVYPSTLTFQVAVQDAVYLPVHIAARVYLQPGVSPQSAGQRIRGNLERIFRISEPDGTPNKRIDFGFNIKDAEGNPSGEVAFSDVFNAIRDTAGVRKVSSNLTLNGKPADVRLGLKQFPVLGTVTLTNGDTGGLL